MQDIDAVFKFRVPNREKLLKNGFSDAAEGFFGKKEIMGGQFIMNISISPDGKPDFTLTDSATDDEYVLVKIADAQGKFVGKVRECCESALCDIASSCYDVDTFKSEQTKRLIEFIKKRFGAEPEFLWADSPDAAPFRRSDNKKWFCLVMCIDKSRIDKASVGRTDIINLKAPPECVKNLIAEKGFYPAYHMNKKHWYTVILDGSIEDGRIFALTEQSYNCAGNAEKSAKSRRRALEE